MSCNVIYCHVTQDQVLRIAGRGRRGARLADGGSMVAVPFFLGACLVDGTLYGDNLAASCCSSPVLPAPCLCFPRACGSRESESPR